MKIFSKIIAAGVIGLLASSTFAVSAAYALPVEGDSGSLTVHKYKQPQKLGQEPSGVELTPEELAALTGNQTLEPLKDVEFEVKQVEGVNLKTDAGWKTAETMSKRFDSSDVSSLGATFGTPVKKVTDVDGVALFNDLPIGLYLVTETDAPAEVDKGKPFLITVPLTHPTNLNEWIYNVHVYPKNAIATSEKEVSDNVFEFGEDIEYKIASPVPGGTVSTKFEFVDTLDSKLTYKGNVKGLIGSTEMTSDMFVANFDSATNKLTVTLSEIGRNAAFVAAQDNAAVKVSFTFDATVNAVGEISNTVFVNLNDATVESIPVVTKWGGFKVKKVDSSGTALPGATFELFASNTNDFSTATKLDVCSSGCVSDSNGEITVDALRYSGFANNAAVSNTNSNFAHYWLVETKAPVGFELLPEPVYFTVDSDSASAVALVVVNVPHNGGFDLPLTGENGIAILIAAGVAVLALGATAAVVTSRKKKTA